MDVHARRQPDLYTHLLHLGADQIAHLLHQLQIKGLGQQGAHRDRAAELVMVLRAFVQKFLAEDAVFQCFIPVHFIDLARFRIHLIMLLQADTGRAVCQDQVAYTQALQHMCGLTGRTGDRHGRGTDDLATHDTGLSTDQAGLLLPAHLIQDFVHLEGIGQFADIILDVLQRDIRSRQSDRVIDIDQFA